MAFGSETNPRPRATYFVRVPTDRWLERLRNRDADGTDLGIAITVVAVAQQQGGVGNRRVTMRLRELHDLLNLRFGERTISNRLRKLRDLGEIAFETTQGQRGPWRIAILPDDYFFDRTIERTRQSRFEVPANLEGRPLSDFEATSHDERARTSAAPARAPITDSELRTSLGETAPDQNKNQEEKKPNHGGGHEVRQLIGHSLDSGPFTRYEETRQWTERFLALLPAPLRNSSARTGIGRRVAQLDEPSLESAFESFRREVLAGGVRKPTNYLYKVLKNEIENAI